VPQRETGMTAYEIMLSESQDACCWWAKGTRQEVIRVFEKWGLDAVEVGRVTADGKMRVLQHGRSRAKSQRSAHTDDAPVINVAGALGTAGAARNAGARSSLKIPISRPISNVFWQS